MPSITAQMILGTVVAMALVMTGCSGSDGTARDTNPTNDETTARYGRPFEPNEQVATSTTMMPTTTTATRRRDSDITDTSTLAKMISENSTGDQQWIDILAELQARLWLAARYPGEHDLAAIYSPGLAGPIAGPTEQDWIGLEAWLDAPLPVLESVEHTRQIGVLSELEASISSESGWFRSVRDDRVIAPVSGESGRYLIVVGRTGDDGRWLIHSITPLRPVGTTSATKESTP